MARLTLSDIISDIRGTSGTHCFSYWKGIHIMKMRSVNYRTARESAAVAPYNSFIARVSQHWYGGLTGLQRNGWGAYSVHIATMGYPYYGSDVIKLVGLRQYGGIMSAFNAFVLTNMLRWSIGKTDILEDDPIAIDPPLSPSFVDLEFELGPPKKLKVTVADPEAVPEPTWLRIFCRGHRMAHLQMVKVVQVFVGGGIPWDITYDCSVEPDAAAPPWTLDGADFCVAAAGIITIDTITPGGVSKCEYFIAVAGFDNSVGSITEFRMKVNASGAADDRLRFRVFDGEYREWLYFSDSKVVLLVDGQEYVMDTTDDFHVYRVTMKDTVVKLFVDGVLRITGGLSNTSPQKEIGFGDDSAVAGQNSNSEWDYIRWYLGGDVAPGVGTYDWQNMRYAKGQEFSLQNDLYSVQMDHVNEFGRYSSPSVIKTQMVRSGFPGGLWGSWPWDNYVWG